MHYSQAYADEFWNKVSAELVEGEKSSKFQGFTWGWDTLPSEAKARKPFDF